MMKEIKDLNKAQVWELEERDKIGGDEKIIKAIWSFKHKRLPDGTYLKHKARLCAHGGMQIAGEHYWDTYSPVVQWMMLRFMMTISQVLGLNSRSIDFTLAYTQAPIDIEIYLELPAGFEVEGREKSKFVLRLKKNLYGLKQAGLSWFETLRTYLLEQGFTQSESDPCFFHRNKLILVCYVDDCLIFAPEQNSIDVLISDLQKNFVLTDEGDVNMYLGIKIEQLRNEKGTEMLKLSQPHLTR